MFAGTRRKNRNKASSAKWSDELRVRQFDAQNSRAQTRLQRGHLGRRSKKVRTVITRDHRVSRLVSIASFDYGHHLKLKAIPNLLEQMLQNEFRSQKPMTPPDFFSDLHLPLTSITRWLSPCTVVDLRNAINLISTTPSPWSTTTGPPKGRRQPTGSTKVEKVKVVDD